MWIQHSLGAGSRGYWGAALFPDISRSEAAGTCSRPLSVIFYRVRQHLLFTRTAAGANQPSSVLNFTSLSHRTLILGCLGPSLEQTFFLFLMVLRTELKVSPLPGLCYIFSPFPLCREESLTMKWLLKTALSLPSRSFVKSAAMAKRYVFPLCWYELLIGPFSKQRPWKSLGKRSNGLGGSDPNQNLGKCLLQSADQVRLSTLQVTISLPGIPVSVSCGLSSWPSKLS